MDSNNVINPNKKDTKEISPNSISMSGVKMTNVKIVDVLRGIISVLCKDEVYDFEFKIKKRRK